LNNKNKKKSSFIGNMVNFLDANSVETYNKIKDELKGINYFPKNYY
jgi:hypothetical protein